MAEANGKPGRKKCSHLPDYVATRDIADLRRRGDAERGGGEGQALIPWPFNLSRPT